MRLLLFGVLAWQLLSAATVSGLTDVEAINATLAELEVLPQVQFDRETSGKNNALEQKTTESPNQGKISSIPNSSRKIRLEIATDGSNSSKMHPGTDTTAESLYYYTTEEIVSNTDFSQEATIMRTMKSDFSTLNPRLTKPNLFPEKTTVVEVYSSTTADLQTSVDQTPTAAALETNLTSYTASKISLEKHRFTDSSDADVLSRVKRSPRESHPMQDQMFSKSVSKSNTRKFAGVYSEQILGKFAFVTLVTVAIIVVSTMLISGLLGLRNRETKTTYISHA